jgi:hypothetical protein
VAEPLKVVDTIGPVVGSLEWAEGLRESARKLAHTIDTGFMRLGEYLYKLYDTPVGGDPEKASVVSYWGYKNIEAFALEELNIHPRKSQFLRRIYYILTEELEGLDAGLLDRIVHIGYAKARILVGILTLHSARDWVEVAENSTYRELQKTIDAYRTLREEFNARQAALQSSGRVVTGGDAAEVKEEEGEDEATSLTTEFEAPSISDAAELAQKLSTMKFHLFTGQRELVKMALEAAGRIATCASSNECVRDGYMLTMICMDYLATNGASPPGTNSFRAYMVNLERLLGIKLIAYAPDTRHKDVLWGVNNIMEFLEGVREEAADMDEGGDE